MSDHWPEPTNPESLYAAAVLAFGPVPSSGWSKARDENGSVVYTTVRGKAARAFTGKVLAFFEDKVNEEYEFKDWTPTHKERIARRWKNDFFRWLWRHLDDCGTEDHVSRQDERGEFADIL